MYYHAEIYLENIEICIICGGSGYRNDDIGLKSRIDNSSYTCNGCGEYNRETKEWSHGKQGKGKRVKWSTQWREYKGDVISISEVKKELKCYTLIVYNKVYHQKEWDGNNFVETGFDGNIVKKLEELGIKKGYLVTIDYHC